MEEIANSVERLVPKILLWAQYTITGDKRAQSAVNYFFKNLGESWKYGY